MTKSVASDQPGRPGRKPSLNAEHTEVLRTIVQEQPRSLPDEATRELLRRTDVRVNTVTVRDAAAQVVALACAKVSGLKKFQTDGAYGGKCARAPEQAHGISVKVVCHPGNRSTVTWQDAHQPLRPETVAKGFVVHAKRWVGERTHAW